MVKRLHHNLTSYLTAMTIYNGADNFTSDLHN